MADTSTLPTFLWQLFQGLRRRGFVMGPAEYEALRDALRAGFGWNSRETLRDLCSSLWAKSRREKEELTALFEQLAPERDNWEYSVPSSQNSAVLKKNGTAAKYTNISNPRNLDSLTTGSNDLVVPATVAQNKLPPNDLEDVQVSERPFIFVPQFPLTYREVAQACRRLRRPIRTGAPIELDIEGTINRRSQLGVSTPIVMQPRRRNLARLLLLVDRQGSMAPFHQFCDEICNAIQKAGRLEETKICYFHNVPAEGAEDDFLQPLMSQLFPVLDPVLSKIQPLEEGFLYTDPELLVPELLKSVLKTHADEAAVLIISDAGAARKKYRVSRLLDTVAFVKALGNYSPNYAWLNPLSKHHWSRSTAAQIARHVPMFELNHEGMQRAVNALRGQQYVLERPL